MRVSTGKCFIFVMKYIKLPYIQAGMMFISLPVFAFYLIQRERSVRGAGRRALQLVPQGWKQWVKRGNFFF